MRTAAGSASCVITVLAASVGFGTPTAQALPAGWLPTNSCGEVGYNPAKEPPSEGGPILPSIPETIHIPLPYPEFVPVPVPGPPVDNTRVPQQKLPDDPCDDPCPDLTDEDEEPADPGSSGSSGSADLPFPRIEIDPQPETIPIPIPGGPGPEPQPAPEPDVHPAVPGTLTPAPGDPAVGDVELVSQITGHGSENRTDKRWQVDGTDLGIIWETEPGEVAIAFGDTFGKDWNPPGANGEDWRSNVLGFSSDTDLSDGMTIDSMVQDSRCHAAEVISSRHIENYETTTIPTSGFAIGDRQFMSYMSVKRWSVVPGMWYTNYGGIAYSDDNGQTWTKSQHAKWENVFGARFQVSAMVPKGDYVYMFGTPNGRIGTIGLARVPKDQVLNPTAYQYWSNGTWTPVSHYAATPIMSGIASELSARYDEASDTWQMSYLDPARGAIVLRESKSPQGAWSEGSVLVDTSDYPKAYGGFIHPWSTSEDLYFTMSEWDSYNVYLMHASLD